MPAVLENERKLRVAQIQTENCRNIIYTMKERYVPHYRQQRVHESLHRSSDAMEVACEPNSRVQQSKVSSVVERLHQMVIHAQRDLWIASVTEVAKKVYYSASGRKRKPPIRPDSSSENERMPRILSSHPDDLYLSVPDVEEFEGLQT